MTDSVEIRFVDNPHAPEVFSSCATGFVVANGCITITFESSRVDHSTNPGPVNRVVIARLTMPISGAQSLSVSLHDFLVNQGLNPSAAVSGGQLPN